MTKHNIYRKFIEKEKEKFMTNISSSTARGQFREHRRQGLQHYVRTNHDD